VFEKILNFITVFGICGSITTLVGLFLKKFGNSILDWFDDTFTCIERVFFPYEYEGYGLSTVESIVYEINHGMIPYTSQDSHGVPLIKVEAYHQFNTPDLVFKCHHKNGTHFFVTLPYNELLVRDYLHVFKLITTEMTKYKDVDYCVEMLKRELSR